MGSEVYVPAVVIYEAADDAWAIHILSDTVEPVDPVAAIETILNRVGHLRSVMYYGAYDELDSIDFGNLIFGSGFSMGNIVLAELPIGSSYIQVKDAFRNIYNYIDA